MTIKVYYQNSCKVFKGSKANDKAKAFASDLSKNGIASKGYLRGTLVWEYKAQAKVTPKRVTKPEIWKVKIEVKIYENYLAFNEKRVYTKMLQVNNIFNSLYEAKKAVCSYIRTHTTDEAYYTHNMGVFHSNCDAEYITVAESVDALEFYEWHNHTNDGIYWFGPNIFKDYDAENICMLPVFVVYKA